MACSEKDLISVYIDGELPEIYKEKLEKHLEECSECKKTYEAFTKSHNLLSKNAQSFAADEAYLDESFKRLQTKLSFAKVTGRKNVVAFDPNFGKTVGKWAISAAAAAAVFALVFTPVYRNITKPGNSEITAIALSSEIQPLNEQNVKIEETIANANIAPLVESSVAKSEENDEISNFLYDDQYINQNQKVVNAAVASYGNSISSMSSIDMFRPEFERSPYSDMEFSSPMKYPYGGERPSRMRSPRHRHFNPEADQKK